MQFLIEAKGSFLLDLPNAGVSIIEDGKLRLTVVLRTLSCWREPTQSNTVEMVDATVRCVRRALRVTGRMLFTKNPGEAPHMCYQDRQDLEDRE